VRRATRNYIIFIALLLPALFQAVSGFVLWLVLPGGEGYRGGRGLAGGDTFILDRHTWLDLHAWVAVSLLVIVVIHLILHWKWIIYVTKGFFIDKG